MKTKDLTQIKNTWTTFGKTEPFWAVLTREKFKKENLNEAELIQFYDTGKNDISYFEEILNQHQCTFTDKTVLEFGCGVGRLTKPCSDICKKIYGLDISQPYLDIAKQNVPNGEFFLVNDFNKLPVLPSNPDVIYSLITLQHNRPILMKLYIFLLLKVLNKSGIALLHIPYKIFNYALCEDDEERMEMHFLKKEDVTKIVKTTECQILSIIETNYCRLTSSDGISDCIYVIKKL